MSLSLKRRIERIYYDVLVTLSIPLVKVGVYLFIIYLALVTYRKRGNKHASNNTQN